MTFINRQIELVEKIDLLIQKRTTGTPLELASKLNISVLELYEAIDILEGFNAPIIYDWVIQSYIYSQKVDFRFGFYNKESNSEEPPITNTKGAFDRLKQLSTIDL